VREPLFVAGYGQFCPVARGAELFAERWTPLIVRELLRGPAHFNELRRGLPRISRSLLSDRLAALERSGIVERRSAASGHGFEYGLTKAGQELDPVVRALGTWAYKWVSRDLTADNLDPALLMWVIERRIRVANLPPQRVVVHFRFRSLPAHTYWLMLERAPDSCRGSSSRPDHTDWTSRAPARVRKLDRRHAVRERVRALHGSAARADVTRRVQIPDLTRERPRRTVEVGTAKRNGSRQERGITCTTMLGCSGSWRSP
jgi:DNA-binding HxlR family transcriptional regulator